MESSCRCPVPTTVISGACVSTASAFVTLDFMARAAKRKLSVMLTATEMGFVTVVDVTATLATAVPLVLKP